jgi:hypothetical protein
VREKQILRFAQDDEFFNAAGGDVCWRLDERFFELHLVCYRFAGSV